MDAAGFIRCMSIMEAVEKLEQLNKNLIKRVNMIERQNEQLNDRITQIEQHTLPIDQDVYNINRRIEILAQKISTFQSNNKYSYLRRLLNLFTL